MLKLLHEKSRSGKAPQGRAKGVAIHESFGSIVAQFAEISVAARGVITVQKITAVVDCGTAVNPAGVRVQVISAVVYGMGAALQGQITFKVGQPEQSNFHEYLMTRRGEAPVVETLIIVSGGRRWAAPSTLACRRWLRPSATRCSPRWETGCARRRSSWRECEGTT
jgi:isoquinoline 1-oxidoreductase beta subunit